jgi:AbrB family looped-hinge helix DNA binding protein
MSTTAPVIEFLTTTSIGEKGQLTVPKEFRDDLRLKAGAPFAVLRIGNGLLLIPEQERFEQLCEDLGGTFRAAGVTVESMLKTLPEIRQEIYEEVYGARMREKRSKASRSRRKAK